MVEQFKVSCGSVEAQITLPQSCCAPQLDEPPHKHVELFILLSNEDSDSQAPSLLLYIQLIDNIDVNSDHNVEACIGGTKYPIFFEVNR